VGRWAIASPSHPHIYYPPQGFQKAPYEALTNG
jgi:hypothetical protein